MHKIHFNKWRKHEMARSHHRVIQTVRTLRVRYPVRINSGFIGGFSLQFLLFVLAACILVGCIPLKPCGCVDCCATYIETRTRDEIIFLNINGTVYPSYGQYRVNSQLYITLGISHPSSFRKLNGCGIRLTAIANPLKSNDRVTFQMDSVSVKIPDSTSCLKPSDKGAIDAWKFDRINIKQFNICFDSKVYGLSRPSNAASGDSRMYEIDLNHFIKFDGKPVSLGKILIRDFYADTVLYIPQ